MITKNRLSNFFYNSRFHFLLVDSRTATINHKKCEINLQTEISIMCYSTVYLVSACAKWWGSEPSWLSWLRWLMTVETCMACKQWYQQWPP